jgi:hypothetical protein
MVLGPLVNVKFFVVSEEMGISGNAFHGFGRNWKKKPDCI